MVEYSPFEVPFNELKPSDLSSLTSVSEGWYIEYKRDVPNAGAVAKSVAAMANTYGGWVFYGIEEKSKENPVAGSFPGVPHDDLDGSLQKIRQSIAGLIHPSPHFEIRAISGPCEQIGLSDGRAIICLHVPFSRRTPHLHKSGVIYRRVGDGSEPRPESDRHAVDQLSRRGQELDDQYEKWINEEPEFSDGERNTSYVRLLLTPDLYKSRDLWLDLNVEGIRGLLKGDGVGIDLPFDIVHTTERGFVATQSGQSDPTHLSLTWWLSRRLTSEVLIPLNSFTFEELGQQQEFGYKYAARLAHLLQSSGASDRKVIDLNQLYFAISGVIRKKQIVLDAVGWGGGLNFKVQLLNVWRKACFLDTELSASYIEAHGIPFCRKSKIDILPGVRADSFLFLSPPDPELTPQVQQQVRAAVILEFICEAVGLPSFAKSEDEEAENFLDLHLAGDRAQLVQSKRSAR